MFDCVCDWFCLVVCVGLFFGFGLFGLIWVCLVVLGFGFVVLFGGFWVFVGLV